MTIPRTSPLRVLVVDDSADARQLMVGMLARIPGVIVAGAASNGREALRLVFELQPDVVTLDLEMPELDGFAFLRLLMSKRPIPTFVVSSHHGRDDVFRALELGALDFLAKPSGDRAESWDDLEAELLAKIELVRRLQVVPWREPPTPEGGVRFGAVRPLPRVAAEAVNTVSLTGERVMSVNTPTPTPMLVTVAASTGGPPAVQRLLSHLPHSFPAAILIAQHMPPRFTRAFAERLDRLVPMNVVEAEDGMDLNAGTVYISPGASHLEVVSGPHRPIARIVSAIDGQSPVAPSGDRLFRTAAAVFGPDVCAVILTGMGNDGTEGARAVKAAGGVVFAEDPAFAVMSGMPASAVEAKVVDKIVTVDGIAEAILDFAFRSDRRMR